MNKETTHILEFLSMKSSEPKSQGFKKALSLFKANNNYDIFKLVEITEIK